MAVTNPITKFNLNLAANILVDSGPTLAKNKVIRTVVVKQVEKKMMDGLRDTRRGHKYNPGVNDDRTAAGLALVRTAERALQENLLSKAALRGVFDIAVKDLFLIQGNRSACDSFKEQFGTYPPGFLVLAPSKACNLQCIGCYADAGPNPEHLDFDTVDKIVTQASELWGSRFIVLTGGEPMAYKSDGKTILDLAERHPNMLFMFYTNGTLITDAVAKRMGELGNLTPAISVEGWKERTDERRGTGVYDKVLAAMARLRENGVPFGVSLTATRHNCEEIYSQEFMHYFMFEQKALYAWVFHYMPIGRKYTLDLMPNPEQRAWMWKRSWELVRNDGIFMMDFWNHGTLCEGCISAGRDTGGGYFYIDWNGAVTPCVFLPYSPVNIKDLFARGETLNDLWKNPFFASLRKWQTNYKQENILMPCPNRDHNQELRQLIGQYEPDPIDDNARTAMLDPEYGKGMDEYDQAYKAVSEKVWQTYYLRKPDTRETELGELPEIPQPQAQ